MGGAIDSSGRVIFFRAILLFRETLRGHSRPSFQRAHDTVESGLSIDVKCAPHIPNYTFTGYASRLIADYFPSLIISRNDHEARGRRRGERGGGRSEYCPR